MGMQDRDWYRAESRSRRAKSEAAASPAWQAYENRPEPSVNGGLRGLHFGRLAWIALAAITVVSFGKFSPSWTDYFMPDVARPFRPQHSNPFPTNGFTKFYFNQSIQKTAPLSLQTSPVDLNRKSVISVRDWKTDTPIATVFLEANTIVTLELPPGIYRLWIASGNYWQNETVLFGDVTKVERSTLPITLVNDRVRVTGFKVQLMQTDHPDFPTEHVSSAVFGSP